MGEIRRSGKNASENLIRPTFILQKHREGLDRVAEELVQKKEISGKEVLELVGVEKLRAPTRKEENVGSSSLPSSA